jgi:hypothetical protein
MEKAIWKTLRSSVFENHFRMVDLKTATGWQNRKTLKFSIFENRYRIAFLGNL